MRFGGNICCKQCKKIIIMKIKFLFLFVIGFNSILISQTDLLWSDEVICDINFNFSPKDFPKVLVENNIIKAISKSNTNNESKLQVIEYSMDGEILTHKFYGNGSTNSHKIRDYVFDNSGYLYLLKTIENELSKVVIQKYDLDTNLIWEQEIESIEESEYINVNIEILNDNQLFIAFDEFEIFTGQENHLVFSYSDTGTFLWQLDLPEINFFTSDITVYDNNLIVFGFNQYPLHSMITIEPDGTRTVIENIEFSGGLHNIFIDDDLNIFATHASEYRLTKLNSSGNVIWTNLYSGQGGIGLKRITDFIKDDQENILITGHFAGGETAGSNDNRLDFLTLKLNPEGEILWENRYHRNIDSGEEPYELVLKNDFLYVCGQSSSNGIGTHHDFVILKMNATAGEETTEYRYDNNGLDDCFFSMVILDNDEIIASGFSLDEVTTKANLITQRLTGITGTLSVSELTLDIVSLYPNPINSNEILKIKNNQFSEYSIVTINGFEVQNGVLNIGEFAEIHLNNYSSGMYLLVLKKDSTTIIKKLIVK